MAELFYELMHNPIAEELPIQRIQSQLSVPYFNDVRNRNTHIIEEICPHVDCQRNFFLLTGDGGAICAMHDISTRCTPSQNEQKKQTAHVDLHDGGPICTRHLWVDDVVTS
jgi:hypothetical protein